MQSTLQLITRWAATLTVALLPLVLIPLPWATTGHAKFALITLGVTVGIVAFVVGRFMAQNAQVPFSFTLLASALIPLAYIGSALVSGTGFLGLERDTVLAAVLWYGALLLGYFGFESRARVLSAYKTLLVLAGVVTLFQLARLMFGPEVLTLGGVLVGPAATLLGSWHDLGIFLGLTAFLAAAFLGSTHAKGIEKIVAYVILGLSLITLILVNPADVWATLGIISLIFAVYTVWSKVFAGSELVSAARSVPVVLFASLAVLGGLFFFVGNAVHAQLPTALQVVQVEVRPSWLGTADVAAEVYKSSGALFGSGPSTFIREWATYRPQGVSETAFWNADFVQGIGFIPTSFVTLGIAGIIAWLLFFGLFAYEGARILLRSMKDMSVEPIAVGLFGGSLILWVMHMVYAPGVAIMGLAFLLTGIAFSWAVHSGLMAVRFVEARGRILGFVFNLVLVIVGAGMLLSGIFMARALLADMYINRSIVTFNTSGDIDGAQAFIARALAIEPGNDRAHRAGVELGLYELAQLAQTPGADQDPAIQAQLQQTLQEAIQHGLAAVESDTRNYQNWLTLAGAYRELAGVEIPGALERAQEAYLSAIQVNPTSPTPHLFLAQLALVADKVDEAQAQIDLALQKKPNFAEAFFLRAQIALSEDDVPGAIDAATKAVEASPQEPVAWFQLGSLLYSQGVYGDAAAALEQAVLLNSNYANALYLLGLSYMRLDETEAALRVLTRVQELNPENESVAETLRALQEPSDPAVDETDAAE